MAAGAACIECIVRVFRVLGLMATGAGLRWGTRILRVGVVAAGAIGMPGRRAPVLDLMALAARRLLRTFVRLVASGAGRVLRFGMLLRPMATSAIRTARLRMVRQVLMAVRALGVAGIRVRACVLGSMTTATQGGRSGALHESVGLVALGAGQVFLAVTVVLSHGAVATRTGERLGAR
jgi:hypothetical protein